MRISHLFSLFFLLPSICFVSSSFAATSSGTIDTGNLYTAVLSTGNADFSGVSSLVSKVFQINVYEYDKVFNSYSLIQYGSAVLVDKDKIVTNAHVVYNEEENKSYFYQICKTTSIKSTPICFTTANLVRLDLDNDLALLKLQNAVKTIQPVVLLSGDKEIGDSIHVLGYPSNGGDTITITEGTIAGYSKGYYKIDANLDEGNSGGGAFDASGYLVGIPSYLQNGYSSLGYVLDVGIVRLFLQGTLGDPVKISSDKAFISYISKIHSLNAQEMIDNNLFTTESFVDIGFSLSSFSEISDRYLYRYFLSNSDLDINLSLDTVQFSSKTTPKQYANHLMTYYKKLGSQVLLSKKTVNNQLWYFLIIKDITTDQTSYLYIQDVLKSNVLLTATITTFADTESSDLQKIFAFVESISINELIKKNPPLETPKFQFAGQQYSVYKSLLEGSLGVFFVPQNARFYGSMLYLPHGNSLEDGALSGLVDFYAYNLGEDSKTSLQYSIENKPYYTIDYDDANGISHVAAIWLIEEQGAYYSIFSDLLLSTKAVLQDAKKALQGFKVSSIIK